MKTRYFKGLQTSLRLSRRSALSAAALLVFSSHSAQAVDYYWDANGAAADTGGTGSWTTTTALWRNGSDIGNLENWVNANTAVLGGTAGTLTTTAAITAPKITVDSTAAGTFAITNGTGGTLTISTGIIDVAIGKALTFSTVVAGTGTTTVQGGGTVTFAAANRAYGGNILATGAGTNVIFSNTNGLDNGTTALGLNVRDGATIRLSGTNNYRAGAINLGAAGFGGGTLTFGNVSSLARQQTTSLNVAGTSKSTILSTLANTGTAFGAINLAGTGFTFNVGSTGDASGVDLEYSAGARNGTAVKSGAGVMRLNSGFSLNFAADYTTFNNASNALSVTAGTFLNEGTIKSITAISGGTLKTGATGVFDQVNLNGGIFEISRASGVFTTGLTYAAAKNAINFNGGTLKYVGINTDYSSQFTFGTSGGTVDTNTQDVTFATALTNSGPFTKAGAGTLTLSAPNALTGAITVTGGVLDLGNFTTQVATLASGTTAGDLILGSATLTLGGTNASTVYAGNISGVGGSIVKIGTGVQSFSGTNTYSGGTSVDAGILVFRTTAAKPASGTVNVAANASLGLGVGGAGFFSSADVDSLYANTLANVNMDLSAGVAIDTTAGNFTYATSQSTRFLTKVGANVLTLTGTNTYTGPTAIIAGTLQYATPGSLYNSDPVQWTAANISVNNGATLAVNIGGAGDFSDAQVDTLITNLSTVISNGFKAGSNFGFDTTNATGDLTYSHVLANPTGTGAGSLGFVKLGAGTLVLDQANTYTGTTTVSAGTLTLSGARTVTSGAFSVGNLPGSTGTLNVTNGTFSTNTFSVGTGDGSALGVVNQSAGTLTLTGTQLILGNGGIAGAAAGTGGNGTYNLTGGTLTATSVANRGIILGTNDGGTSTFNLSGAGNLDLTGALSVLMVGRSDAAVINTTNVFNQSGGTAAVRNLTIGGGAVAATGLTSTFTVTGGTFAATAFGAFGVGSSGTATINIGGTAVVTLPSFPTARGIATTTTINFNGGTLKAGAAGTNYMSGLSNAFIKSGGITLDTNGFAIAIAQPLLADPSSTGGGLTKQGAGTLTLSGANTYTGGTLVIDDTLALVGGSQSSPITVGNGAFLGFTVGSGTTSTSTVTFGATAKVKITGTPTLPSYTLMTTTGISGTPVLDVLITGYELVVDGTSLKLNALPGYPAWQIANGTNQTIDLDHDSDGVANGVEFFLFGPVNTTGFTALPGVTNTGGTLSVTFTKAASYTGTYGTDFFVETSSTLTGAWTPATLGAGAGQVVITGNDVKYTFPSGTVNFARLQISK